MLDFRSHTGLVYLASPYTHPSINVQVERFNAACRAASWLMSQGVKVFSPIAHSHPLTYYGLPGDWGFWQAYNHEFLAACRSMIVLTLDGWKESKGVTSEIAYMHREGRQVDFLAPIIAVQHGTAVQI